jgi:DNA-binding NtrC family response regulator
VSAQPARILVVEDNETLRHGIVTALCQRWTGVEEASTGSEAVARIAGARPEPFDVVLTDLRLPDGDGVSVLRAARKRDDGTSVILMTAYGSIEVAVDAMRSGAFDFVEKPIDLDQLELRVSRAVEHRRLIHEVSELRAERAARDAAGAIVGSSPALRAAIDLAHRVAPTRSTILITGETGTGKELIAGLIHEASPRVDGSLVKVNCAALPETLLESELFGHERGAFTGADRQRIGRFEQASGGTLFLDEVGDTSPATQAKLLRVLQEQQFHRLGGSKLLHTDARIISATNQDLEALIKDGGFREDLFFRLNVIRIHLPPLRERPEDLIDLAHHFVQGFAEEQQRPIRGFTEDALARIRAHRWPGNVRELHNTLERAMLMTDGGRICAQDLSIFDRGGDGPAGWRPELPPEGLALQEVERRLVLEVLERTGYVQKHAAELLQISRRKLNYMIQRLAITHPTWRRNVETRPKPGAEGPAGP